MKRLVRAMMMITVGWRRVFTGLRQPACGPVVVRAEVEAAPGRAKPGGFAAPGPVRRCIARRRR